MAETGNNATPGTGLPDNLSPDQGFEAEGPLKTNTQAPPAAETLKPHDDIDIAVTPSHLVAVGASAGGLEALERFFRAVPDNSGLCYVVLQHLSPDFRSLMGELLGRFNAMPVVPVEKIEQIRPNTIFLLPPKKEMTVQGNYLVPRAREKDGVLSLPINTFFYSLAAEWGERAVAVVLSGTGSDGSKGILDVRDAGGIVIAQVPETAAFDGMPQNAIRTGCVDTVLPPEEMPNAILAAAQTATVGRLHGQTPDYSDQSGMELIFSFLNHNYGINFGDYKSATITRRISRRVSLKVPPISVDEYAERLSTDAEELNLLYKDLLIGVTSFFRDPDVFNHLRDNVIPGLLETCTSEEEIRLWTAGCSTGEEPYSLAILFLEELEAKGQSHKKLKVMATDLHEDSLRVASDGIYPAEALSNVSAEYLKKYFLPSGEGYFKVSPHLRRCLVFSKHNILVDPPFTRIHFVSCRNMLIYFLPKAQQRAIASLVYALTLNGVLLLGISETPGEIDGIETDNNTDRKYKIYRKITHQPIGKAKPFSGTLSMPGFRANRISAPMPLNVAKIYEGLLSSLVPTGVLVSDTHEVIHIFGDVDGLLVAPKGRFSGSIIRMLPQELSMALGSVFHKVAKERVRVELRGISAVLQTGESHVFNMIVQPVTDPQNNLTAFLIQFERNDLPLPSPVNKVIEAAAEGTSMSLGQVQDLEHELQATRETLQTTIEELETTNEELQSTNEELLSSNEELQSTNEELHSVNEELYSVNSEHEAKIEELNRTTNNLHYLMQSSDTATIFLDEELRITLYTPGILNIFSLLPKDVGRRLTDFKMRVNDETLFIDLDALSQVPMVERELPVSDGIYWLRRCARLERLPSSQPGYVINYFDVTRIVKMSVEASVGVARFDAFMRHIPAISWISEEDGTYDYISASFADAWQFNAEHFIGRTPDALFSPETARRIRDQEQQVWETGQTHESVDLVPMPDGSQHAWHTIRFPFSGAEGRRYLGGVSIDVTDVHEKATEAELLRDGVIEKVPFGVAVFDKDGKCLLMNTAYAATLALQTANMQVWTLEDHVRAGCDAGLYGPNPAVHEVSVQCTAKLAKGEENERLVDLPNGGRLTERCIPLKDGAVLVAYSAEADALAPSDEGA